MAQITWRDVVGAPDTGAFRGLSAVGDTINSGFAAVDKALSARLVAGQAQQDIARQGGVNAYLDRVQQANTPEALAQLQQSGELDALRSKIDPRDLGLVRGADETRLSAVRDNTAAAQKFQDSQTIYANRDLVNQAQALFATGDKAGALKALEPIQHVLPNYGEQIAKGTAVMDAHNHLVAQTGLEQAQTGQAQAEATAIPLRTQNEAERTRITERGNNIQLLTALETRLAGAGAGGGAGGAAGASGTDGSSDVLTNTLNKVFSKDPAKAEVMGRLMSQAQLHDDPAKAALLRNLPADTLERVAKASSDMWGTGKYNPLDLGAAGRLQGLLLKQLDDPSVLAETVANMQAPKRRLEQAGEVKSLRQGLMHELFPNSVPAAGAVPVAGTGVGTSVPAAASPDVSAAAELAREGKRGAPASVAGPTAAPTGVPLPDFRLDPGLEKAAEAQQLQMSLGTRTLFTPEVDKYLKAKNAAIDAINTDGPAKVPAFNPAARAPQAAAWSIADSIARRQAEEAAKKAK